MVTIHFLTTTRFLRRSSYFLLFLIRAPGRVQQNPLLLVEHDIGKATVSLDSPGVLRTFINNSALAQPTENMALERGVLPASLTNSTARDGYGH